MTRTAFVATYPPRQCGVAAYTGELSRVTPDREVVAIHPLERIAPYAFEVHHRIRRDERADYARVAHALERCVDVVSIQFDAGLWGGEDGEAVLDFTRALTLPAAATLHTLARDPSPRQREIVVELAASVGALVVMSEAASTVLAKRYGIDPYKVRVIPYGIPDLPIMPAATIKPSVDLHGRSVLLSFGLLHPGKGYERVLEALPAIVTAHPTTTYVILGNTHPDVVRRDGEAYRASLTARAAALGVAGHVRIIDEFVGRVELTRWLQATDVFITPNADLGAMVSGPLAYGMAAGRAIVSTRFPYATELLAGGRGVLVANSAAGLAGGVLRLLGDEKARLAMGGRAHEHSRSMSWTRVGAAYQAVLAGVAVGAMLPDAAPDPGTFATS